MLTFNLGMGWKKHMILAEIPKETKVDDLTHALKDH